MDKYSIDKQITLPYLRSDGKPDDRKVDWAEHESYRKCNHCGHEHYIYYFGRADKTYSISKVCPKCGERYQKLDYGHELGYLNTDWFKYLVDWFNTQDFPGKIDTNQKLWRVSSENIKMLQEVLRPLDGWDESFTAYIDRGRSDIIRYRRVDVIGMVTHKEIDREYPPKPENYFDENVFRFLRFLRRNITGDKKEKLKNLIEATELACTRSTPPTALQNKMDPAQLKEYLGELIDLETSIYSLTKRMEVLYFEEAELAQAYRGDLIVQIREFEAKQKQLQKAYEKLLAEKPVVDPASLIPPLEREDMTSKYPPLPAEPQPPVLEEAKFFNKKKVEEANRAKTAAYEKARQEWEAAIAERDRTIKALEQQATDVYNRKREALIQEYAPIIQQEQQKKDQEYASTLAKVKAAHQQISDEIGKLTEESENMNLPLTLEKVEAEQMLKDLIEARCKLLSYNVIFPKYRNLVAYTTMYEYLLTGRCETLEGPTGAYNLYESEIRANMIISQLSTIITSLEQIKNNQYLLYTELQSVNAGLRELNRTTAKMSETMTSMNESLTKMADNSDVIAYNTSKIAFYSEKTAKLTDALGYMVALK